MRALDGGDSAAFSSSFLATSFFCSQALSTPAPPSVTLAVGRLSYLQKVLRQIMGIPNMESFEQAWERVAVTRNDEAVSAELRPLLQQVHEKIVKQPSDFQEIKDVLIILLFYLSSEFGRTWANCLATDLFFCLADWGVDWESFPEPLTDIIGDMGGALHDTVSNPEIARNFESLPEQLLERAKQWKPK